MLNQSVQSSSLGLSTRVCSFLSCLPYGPDVLDRAWRQDAGYQGALDEELLQVDRLVDLVEG